MKKLLKNCLAMALALALCLTLLPLTVFADGVDSADPETCEHNWNWVQTTPPDCLNGGEETRTCTKCGTTGETRPAAALGHDYTRLVEYTVAPTCFKGGEGTFRCTRCDAEQTRAVSALAHDYTHDDIIPKVPATCTQPGVKAHYTCGRCGGTFGTGTFATTDLEIKPLGHSWGEWTETKPATTEEAGLETRTCNRAGCGETEEKEIPRLTEKPGHVHSWNTSQWHSDEDNHYHYCTLAGCDARTDEAAHVYDPAKGSGKCEVCGKYHNHTGNYVDGRCSVCGAPCGHPNRDNVEHSDATCLHEGTIAHFYCRDCGQYIALEGDSNRKPVTSTAISKDSGNHDDDCALAYADNGDGTHDQKYTCGVIEVAGEAHEDTDNDNLCDKCNAAMSSGSGETTDPVNPDPDPQPGYEIPDPNVPLGDLPGDGEVEIEDVDVPLAGLMTRAEFVNYLYVQAGSPAAERSTFTDVAEDHEYAVAIGWAQANGITKGVGNNEFAPDDLVAVEQARLFLERYAKFQGFEMPELAALAGKDPKDILDNADEALTEFFGEDLGESAA